jgi:hypothetical protein
MDSIRLKLVTMEPGRIQTRKNGIMLSWWGESKTFFPLTAVKKQSLIEVFAENILTICYFSGKGKKEKIVAVDAVYQKGWMGGGVVFETARLLGDEVKVPMVKDLSKIEMSLEPTPAPRRKVCIRVIEREGEKLFEAAGVFFDNLNADMDFVGGALYIYRDGELFDKTTYIEWYGTHGACPCFQGFRKPFEGDQSPRWAVSGVGPEDFKVGDKLVLEYCVPLDMPFDFGKRMRIDAGFLSAFIHSFDEKPSLTTKELETNMHKNVPSALADSLSAPVVRFRNIEPTTAKTSDVSTK